MKKILSLVLAFVLMLSALPAISVVAEGEVTGKIEGATLNIGSSLTIDYYATFSAESDAVTMRFTSSSGRITNVKGEYDSQYNMYRFSYTGINPQCMADTINAELLLDGETLDTKADYSVKSYCDSQITKTEADLGYTTQQLNLFKALLADMLVYGGTSQEYKNYNTENLASASDWVGEYASEFAEPRGVREVEGNSDASNRVKSLGLNMSNVNKIYFKLILTDDATVKLNGNVVDKKTLKKDNGTFVLYTNDINATEFDDVYTLTIEKNGIVISKVRYNVNAYIEKMYLDGNVDDITKALYNYGYSAEKYIQAMKAQTEGGDFDLGEEDDLSETVIVNLIPERSSSFESATSVEDSGWTRKVGTVPVVEIVEDQFGKCLHFTKVPDSTNTSYSSAMFDFMSYVKEQGIYTLSFRYKVKGADENGRPFGTLVRTQVGNSFSTASGTNFFCSIGSAMPVKNDEWGYFEGSFNVTEEDIGVGGYWGVALSSIQSSITDIYIDDFKVYKKSYSFPYYETVISTAETWVANELVLVSDKVYADPFNDVDVDLILTNGTTTYTVPGFWDGDLIWRVRFTCPTAGEWTYTTVCTDKTNTGLHGKTNTLTCTKYSGDLEIYKRGFVKTEPNTKHFMYADGTPFFYLGDTHWNFGLEPLDIVKTVADHRVEQGYNVWQSEPLGGNLGYENGIVLNDVLNIQKFDEKFKYVAEKGLVHANAQFFFPSSIEYLVQNFGGYDLTKPYTETLTNSNGVEFTFYDLSDTAKAYLEKICRYWVARYSAYPVMWTLGQEVDNDYYWQTVDKHNNWSYVNNPYKLMAEYIGKYDPYKSPLSAHQEGHTTTAASDSAFRDVEEHTWYASQWKPGFNKYNSTSYNTAKDYWNNGQGKPVVNYEGKYCYLWTKNFGARAQGWMSFLSGMFGHGYGAQDTWCYTSDYSEDVDTDDGVDIVTKEEKQEMTWQDALEFESSYQLCYMKDFFEDTVEDWWNLIPRFNDPAMFTGDTKLFYIASNASNSKIVIYFYNFSDNTLAETPNSTAANAVKTGSLKSLDKNVTYNYMWFNPVTGKVDSTGTVKTDSSGNATLPQKTTGDMVLYLYK